MNSELMILNRILKEMINGKKVIPYKRQGKIFLRKYRKPKDPRTTKQIRYRRKFKKAVNEWKNLTKEEKEKYKQSAKELSITGFNLFISKYLKKEEN